MWLAEGRREQGSGPGPKEIAAPGARTRPCEALAPYGSHVGAAAVLASHRHMIKSGRCAGG